MPAGAMEGFGHDGRREPFGHEERPSASQPVDDEDMVGFVRHEAEQIVTYRWNSNKPERFGFGIGATGIVGLKIGFGR